MNSIDAIYRHGVFEPLQPVNLREDQRVRLNIEAAERPTPAAWLEQILSVQAEIVARQGILPDSASDIAADRAR